jgi:hypothetical protein
MSIARKEIIRHMNRARSRRLVESSLEDLAETEIVQFCDYTGGLPALTQQGFQYLAQDKTKGWHELRQVAALSDGPFGHHLWGLA